MTFNPPVFFTKMYLFLTMKFELATKITLDVKKIISTAQYLNRTSFCFSSVTQ